MKKILCITVMSFIFLCGLNAQGLVASFNREGSFTKQLHPTTQHTLGTTAQADQRNASYAPDTWENTYLHRGDTVTQGIGGTSCYYSIPKALRTVSYDSVKYWKSLQVGRNPKHGYRKQVRLYIVNADSIPVAIGQVLANPALGPGNAWQFFIETSNASKLRKISDVNLTKHP